MKKTATILLTFVILTLFASSVKAQALTFDRAYQDYLFSITVYNQSYSDYQDAKNAYLANKTLALKEQARQKTLVMLRNRDQLMVVHLTALRAKISETKGLNDSDKNTVFGKLDSEVTWYTDHKSHYGDNDPLDILFGKSDEAKSRYKTDTTPIIYESLFDISLGEDVGIRQSQEQIYAGLRTIVDQGVQAGKLDLNTFNRWYMDIDSLFQSIKENDDLAKTQIQGIYNQYYSVDSSYNTAIETLAASIKSLGQLNNFLFEITASIKNQQ